MLWVSDMDALLTRVRARPADCGQGGEGAARQGGTSGATKEVPSRLGVSHSEHPHIAAQQRRVVKQ